MPMQQANRLLVLKTPLGEDVLELTAFSGVEEISRLFSYHLEMISDNNAIEPAQIVGKPVSFGVKLPDGTPRWFNGFVSRFFAGDEDQKGRRNYRAEVVPWLWFLTRTSDCRIFQNKSVPDIIQADFQGSRVQRLPAPTQGAASPTRTYCVQYRETDFDFVSRLMEEEGIFYFFKHEDGKHTLVLADEKGAYTDCKESEVDYPRDAGTRAVADHITRWEHRYEFRSGKIAQTDYNFEDHPPRDESTPAKLMMSSQSTTVKLDNIQKYEFYDYPGAFEKKDHGENYTKIRMEEEEAGYDVVDAASTCRTFTPGGKFKIKRHLSKSEEGKTYAITSIQHSATEPGAYETGEAAEDDYSNSFTCIPDSVTFRPPRVTPRPLIYGAQTAVVVGPSGEEIYPDKYGRVKVQFHWDREGKRNENSSCWIRVRAGHRRQELGHDPHSADRPGSRRQLPGRQPRPAHHHRRGLQRRPDAPLSAARQKNPKRHQDQFLAKAAAAPTKSAWTTTKARSRFSSTRRRTRTKSKLKTADETVATRNIGSNRTETVGKDESITIGGNRTETVGKDESITIGGRPHRKRKQGRKHHDRRRPHRKRGKDENITIGGSRTENVGKDESISIAGGRNESVGKDESISIDGGRSESVGKDENIAVGKEPDDRRPATQIVLRSAMPASP